MEDAARHRLRAILTTMVGVAPLVLIPGAGTELHRGLGAIVMFGVAFSTVVTLTFLPSLMVTVLELLRRTGRPPTPSGRTRLDRPGTGT